MGWNRSLVESAAVWLAQRFHTRELGDGIDLQATLVVVPGRRFGRELLAELVEIGEKAETWVSPGRVLTPGEICGALLGGRAREASGLMRSMAWGNALRQLSAADFEVLVRRRPEVDASAEWLRLGAMIDLTVGELARELVLPGEVPERCDALKQMGGGGDAKKWDVIEATRASYQRLLAQMELVDGHLSHLAALRDKAKCRTSAVREIVLIGVVELDNAAREAIAASGLVVTALVFGPNSEAKWVDELGCVRTDLSRERVALRGDAIEFADDFKDGAKRAVGRIASWTNEHRGLTPRDVSVCAPEPAIAAELSLAARDVEGLQFHDASGREIGRASVVKLLAQAGEHVREGTAESLAKLVRRPEVERWIAKRLQPKLGWIARMDEAAVLNPAAPTTELDDQPGGVAKAAAELLGVLASESDRKRTLGEHLDAVIAFLECVLGEEEPNERETESLRVIADAIAELKTGADLVGPLSSWRAMELLLDAIREERIAAPSRRGEVEVLGWLEAAADRAPNIAIVGLNEGLVPRGRVEDSLLPDGVRGALGMPTGRSRAERDAFLLDGMVRSREGREGGGEVWAICAKKDGEGNPLKSSRLLFRCDDEEAIARIERAVNELPEPARFAARAHKPAANAAAGPGFPVAPLHEMEPPKSIRTTAFKEYIHSPYVFFLKRVARLEEIEEPAVEADQGLMGSLLHRVLSEFGRSDARTQKREEPIADWVLAHFESVLGELPARKMSAVREVQIEVAKRRLRTFARVQAGHAADGWSIHATEWESPTPVEIEAPGGRVLLSGRIDRIDRRDSEWLVLDYKTSDSKKDPEKAHFKAKQWTDLQLPLYVYMLRVSGLAPNGAKAGYFVLPKQSASGDILIAEWEHVTFEQAEARAREIVEAVLGRRYEPGDDPYGSGGIARLCGVTLLEAEAGAEE
ncbi:MAG: PD-(D/E)XK nuclease family protein [Phycisphaerales bacterium]